MPEPFRILVVCTANIARSPLAAAMLAREAAARTGDDQPVEVVSAGVRAVAGSPAAQGSRLAAAEHGLDLDGHRSAPIDRDMVDEADLVITMEAAHRDAIARLAPGSLPRTFTLRELGHLLEALEDPTLAGELGVEPGATASDVVAAAHRARPRTGATEADVDDPIGLPTGSYRALGDELHALIARVAAALFDRS